MLYGPIISEAAKKFKGCYTRYVNNYDEVRGSSSGCGSRAVVVVAVVVEVVVVVVVVAAVVAVAVVLVILVIVAVVVVFVVVYKRYSGS